MLSAKGLGSISSTTHMQAHTFTDLLFFDAKVETKWPTVIRIYLNKKYWLLCGNY